MGLGLHIPGMPVADWTTACGVIQEQQPVLFGAIVAFISIAEGESVGHSGDSFRGKSTKEPGNLGFDVSVVCYDNQCMATEYFLSSWTHNHKL
jgi:hypothetical protein